MAHENRSKIQPPLKATFEEIYNALEQQPNKTINGLLSTGGKPFIAKAATSSKVGNYILLPYNNRIYHCCWGNTTNHMGKDGQRIGQYSRALDNWLINSND